MAYIPKRSVFVSQKGGSGYGNGYNPNQERGMYGYDNAYNPNQEGGILFPDVSSLLRQMGGARTKHKELKRMQRTAADTRARLNEMAANAGMVIPEEDEDDYMPLHQSMSTRRRQKAAADFVARKLSRDKARALKKAETAARNQAKRDAAKARTAEKRALAAAAREATRTAAMQNRQNKRTERQNANRNRYGQLAMVQDFRRVNPGENASNLHNLTSGWKLHGSNLGPEKPGKKNALLRFFALSAAKHASNPNSPYMKMLSDGTDLDVDKEYERTRRAVNMERSGSMRFVTDAPIPSTSAAAAASSGLNALAQAAELAAVVSPPKKKRSRKKVAIPDIVVRRSARMIERMQKAQSGKGRVQRGGAIPLLPIAMAAAPLLGGLLKKIF